MYLSLDEGRGKKKESKGKTNNMERRENERIWPGISA